MHRARVAVVPIVLLLSCGLAVSASGVELSEHLAFLDRLADRTWVGHYANGDAAHLVHVVEWEGVYSGNAVRMTKHVDELGFAMESLYYWNADSSEVALVTVTSRGQASTGTASARGDTIELLGQDLTSAGQVPYRYTFHVTDDGVLEDRFYRLSDDGWVEHHLIRYEGEVRAESAEPAN